MAARWLGPDERLPRRPRRVLVAGASGAGKTWLADEVARRLGLVHVEVDGLYHGPGWQPRADFETDVAAVAAGEGWALEWQYASVRALLADRADLLVWLDLPRPRVLAQVVGRTLRRRMGRQELWNGNREPPLRTILTDPEHIVRWSWSSHPSVAPRVLALASSHPDLLVVRLRSRAEVRRWLDGPLTAS